MIPHPYRDSPEGLRLWATMQYLRTHDPVRPNKGQDRQAMKRAVGRVRDILEAEAASRWRDYFTVERQAMVQAAERGALSKALEDLDGPHPLEALRPTLTATLTDGRQKAMTAWMGWRGTSVRKFGPTALEDILAVLQSQDVQDWLRTNLGQSITGISTRSQNSIARAIAEALSIGDTLKQIAEIVEALYMQSAPARAATIAANEVGHSVSFIENFLGYTDGATKKEWISMRDLRVREAHDDADDGEAIDIDEPFEVGDDLMMFPYDESLGAGADNIVNCFVAGTAVSGRFMFGTRMLYRGVVREIATVTKRLTVTPHHPIATPGGFIPAAHLRKGDRVLTYGGWAEGPTSGHHHHEQNEPAKIEEVFETLAIAGRCEMSVTPNQFHGDAISGQGDVEVVAADGELLARVAAEHRSRLSLVSANAPQVRHHRLRPSDLTFKRLDTTSAGSPGGPTLPCEDASVGRGRFPARPFQVLSVGSAAELDSALCECTVQAASRYMAPAALFGKRQERLAVLVAEDEIIEIRDYEWSGHVYDLQSSSGVLVAQGIVTSNCRCFVVYS